MQISPTSAPVATRATVYFDGEVRRELSMKAAASGLNTSDLINRAAGAALSEDADDVRANRERAGESSLDFADVVLAFKASVKI